MKTFGLASLDIIALLWFVGCWTGYTFFSAWKGRRSPSLLLRMDHYRMEWMRRVMQRDNRIVDSAIVQNLFQGNNFLASTSMLILGGLVAVMGTSSRAFEFVSSLPMAQASSEPVFEIKMLLLIVIFVYAFFKFTWAMRQFNFLSILLGAAPDKDGDPGASEEFIRRAAALASLAGENSNRGLRAFYFALAEMAWFIHPWMLLAMSSLVVGVLYHREFRSRTLLAMMDGD